jgi:hypothetical protein
MRARKESVLCLQGGRLRGGCLVSSHFVIDGSRKAFWIGVSLPIEVEKHWKLLFRSIDMDFHSST